MLSLLPAYPAFGLLFCPLSPQPPSPAGKGEIFLFSYARGFAPCIPWTEPGRHRSRGRTTHPAGVCLRNRQLAAKPIEQPFYWQCRQPRRGGTGGDGTIRRKRRRRLRWSPPPGQVEQMPHGERSPAPPLGGTGAGGVSRAGGGACPAAAVPGGRAVPPPCLLDLPEPSPAGEGQGSTPKAGLAGGKEGKLPPRSRALQKNFQNVGLQ